MRGARYWSPNADLLEDLRLLLQSVSNPSFSYLLAVPLSKVRNGSKALAERHNRTCHVCPKESYDVPQCVNLEQH
jgi:hypothetical protein